MGVYTAGNYALKLYSEAGKPMFFEIEKAAAAQGRVRWVLYQLTRRNGRWVVHIKLLSLVEGIYTLITCIATAQKKITHMP